jgi:hypothetical protein
MEYGSRIRFVLFTLLGILLLILSAWGVIALANRVFGTKNNDTTAKVQKIDVNDYARASTSVKLRVEGPVVGNEQFVSYEIEVAQNYRKITTFKGYDNVVTSQKRYDNTVEGYRTFLRALDRIGYTTKVAGASDDETAACATGKRYIYSLHDESEEVSRLWNTSCTTKQGSMSGSGVSVRSLFKAQVPDYTTILTGPLNVLQ